jgi:hypothetical protein
MNTEIRDVVLNTYKLERLLLEHRHVVLFVQAQFNKVLCPFNDKYGGPTFTYSKPGNADISQDVMNNL